VVVAVRAVLVTTPHSAASHDGSCRDTYASSNSRASLRKAFLHFLHIKTMSKVCISVWSACSAWHSAQSNHFLPGRYEPLFSHSNISAYPQHGERIETCALRTCLLRRPSATEEPAGSCGDEGVLTT
jgi:hypothetical protein